MALSDLQWAFVGHFPFFLSQTPSNAMLSDSAFSARARDRAEEGDDGDEPKGHRPLTRFFLFAATFGLHECSHSSFEAFKFSAAIVRNFALSLTLGSPPLVISTPADCKAAHMALSNFSDGLKRLVSKNAMLALLTFAWEARTFCVQPSSFRAALTWAPVIIRAP
jgi:hypothetical protein